MNLLHRLFGKKKKPVPPTMQSTPFPRGISGRSLGSSSNTDEDDYYRRKQQEHSYDPGLSIMSPDYGTPANESGFGGFGGGSSGGGGASGSWDSGSSDSGSHDSGSSSDSGGSSD